MYAQITFAVAKYHHQLYNLVAMNVRGVALGTLIVSASLALIVHKTIFSKTSNLTFTGSNGTTNCWLPFYSLVSPAWPNLEVSVFSVSHNISMDPIAGTDGVASFTVLNYIHGKC
ncbi:hypothetical protein [Paenibacillus sp. M2]|uniref:hypothetical protein n=1 Tax=Paenibacillus sp. M2 TaxID=3341793 RepID=UPI00398A3548